MAGEDKAKRIMLRYRNVFFFLGIVLIVQVFIAIRVILIADTSGSSPSSQAFVLPVENSDRRNEARARDSVSRNGDPQPASNRIPAPNPKNSAQAQTQKGEVLPPTKLKASTEQAAIPNSSSPPKLNLESLDFVPSCTIDGKEAVSAITRAKTQQCKEHLADTTCSIVTDVLYPKRLQSLCKYKDTTYMKHVGCFRDEKTVRLLPEHYILQKETNSPQNCIDVCLQSGFPYAGVQYSIECFCGNTRPPVTAILEPSLCNMKCPSATLTAESLSDNTVDQTEDNNCGGYYAMNVYETGVNRDETKASVAGFEDITDAVFKNASSGGGHVRIVFFLTLNGRALRQVIRVIKTLFHKNHYFYIHVDARQDYLFRELLQLQATLPRNVRFMRERMSTIWGGASLLKVLLSGMTDLVENSKDWDWKWDYVINMSESDFPLKPVEQLERFLTVNRGRNFLKSHGREVQKFIQKQGLDKTFDECDFRMWRLSDRKLPSGILIDGGSDWFGLHHDFITYIVKTDDELVAGLKTVFAYTLLPAESFFHTALRNSEYCETFVDNNLRVTNWKRKLGCKCQYRNVVDWCGCSPNDFRIADWSRLESTETKLIFFGRKFEPVVNQAIINKLESKLAPSRSESNFPTLDRYWQSIYHHKDMSPKPDDSLLTLGSSLTRISAQAFAQLCLQKIRPQQSAEVSVAVMADDLHFVEASVYVQGNEVQGILVRLQINVTEQFNIQLESWLSLLNWVQYEPISNDIAKYHSKIQAIRVGTDYDQKEQIFRNFAGSMGPLSEPTLAYHVYSDVPLNITFVWMNSAHAVQAVNNFTVSGGETANFVKPALKVPLLPGNWTVKILSEEGNLIAYTKFLIIPLQFYHENPITAAQEKLLNGKNSNVVGRKEDAIDALVSKFYQVQDTCLESELGSETLGAWFQHLDPSWIHYHDSFTNLAKNSHNMLEMTLCKHTQWSSLFPDPKATITGVDLKTGLLIP